MLKLWAIKNKISGYYFSAYGNNTSAPSVYLSKGKAEGRRKQLHKDYQVVEWVVTETVVE